MALGGRFCGEGERLVGFLSIPRYTYLQNGHEIKSPEGRLEEVERIGVRKRGCKKKTYVE